MERWFGKFPRSKKPTIVAVPAPAIKCAEVTIEDSFAKLRQVQFVWHSPANFGPGDAELDIAASALSREGPGRLYKELTYTGLAQSVSAFQYGSGFSGMFTVSVTQLREYVLVSQHERRIDVYRRDGRRWHLDEYADPHADVCRHDDGRSARRR